MFPRLNHGWVLISRETCSRKNKSQSYLICHDFNLTSMAGGVTREDGDGTARGLHLTSERYWGKIFGAAVPWDGEAGGCGLGAQRLACQPDGLPGKQAFGGHADLAWEGQIHRLSFSASGREHTKQGENKVYLQEMGIDQHQGNQTGPEGNECPQLEHCNQCLLLKIGSPLGCSRGRRTPWPYTL